MNLAVPYARYLQQRLPDAISEMDYIIKKDNAKESYYALYKTALLIINNEEVKALKIANKSIGSFPTIEMYKLALSDSLWNIYEREGKRNEFLTPVEVFFTLDLLKKLEPQSVATLTESFKANLIAFRKQQTLDDDAMLVKLGAPSLLSGELKKEKVAIDEKKEKIASSIDLLNTTEFLDKRFTNYVFTDWETARKNAGWKAEDNYGNNQHVNRQYQNNIVVYQQLSNAPISSVADVKLDGKKDWFLIAEFTAANSPSESNLNQGFYLPYSGGRKDKGKIEIGMNLKSGKTFIYKDFIKPGNQYYSTEYFSGISEEKKMP